MLLVVDDDQVVLRACRHLFEGAGFTVTCARSVASATDVIAASVPAAVVLDINLGPGGNGFDVIGRLRSHERTKDVPVVMHTVSQNDDDLARAHRLGVAGYVYKMESLTRLVEVVLASVRTAG